MPPGEPFGVGSAKSFKMLYFLLGKRCVSDASVSGACPGPKRCMCIEQGLVGIQHPKKVHVYRGRSGRYPSPKKCTKCIIVLMELCTIGIGKWTPAARMTPVSTPFRASRMGRFLGIPEAIKRELWGPFLLWIPKMDAKKKTSDSRARYPKTRWRAKRRRLAQTN